MQENAHLMLEASVQRIDVPSERDTLIASFPDNPATLGGVTLSYMPNSARVRT